MRGDEGILGGHARVSGYGLHMLVEQAHHEGLEIGPPPLREAVPDLPIILRAVRLIELAWQACQQKLSGQRMDTLEAFGGARRSSRRRLSPSTSSSPGFR